jgi:hypothetical protein
MDILGRVAVRRKNEFFTLLIYPLSCYQRENEVPEREVINSRYLRYIKRDNF